MAVVERKPLRGRASEEVVIPPGPGVRHFAYETELEQWAWRRVRSLDCPLSMRL